MKMKCLSVIFLIFGFTFSSFANDSTLTIATTTSTDNSGLINFLIPKFEKKYNIKVKVIATGTGKAIKIAQKGDVDLILVHAPKKEEEFVKSGYGIERKKLMYNHFLVAGPKEDPAKISKSKNVIEAFRKIYNTKNNFISRGDDSGTNVKEKMIWHKTKLKPKGSWYKEVGQGMGKSLQIANELNSYILVDFATWLKLKNKTDLKNLFWQDKMLFNLYSVILVNPKKNPKNNFKIAKIFADWIISKPTKKLISQYKINNKQLFYPY